MRITAILFTSLWIAIPALAAGKWGSLVALSAEQLRLDGSVVPKTLSAHHPKMDDVLSSLAEAARQAPEAALAEASLQGVTVLDGRVQVEILVSLANRAGALQRILEMGGQVTGTDGAMSSFQAFLPLPSLSTLADRPEIHFLRRPAHAVTLATSERASALNAPAWHSSGATGGGRRSASLTTAS